MAIKRMGELVEYMKAAAQNHQATPMSDIFVRVGAAGPLHRIKHVKGTEDQRGFAMILELDPVPETVG